MLAATPGAGFDTKVQQEIGDMIGPDKGTTKVVERVGISVMLGLQKADPFPKDKCDFGDPKCIVGPGCSTPGVCYHLSCGECEPVDQGDQGEPRRHQYIGQTGTSLHRRMLGHLAKGDTVINKHKEEYHLQRNQEKIFNMRVL